MFVEELALNTHTRLNLFKKHSVFSTLKNLNVLDYGCGSGFFTSLIVPWAKKVYCLDIAKENIDFVKKRFNPLKVECLLSNGRVINLPNQSVDAIFCTSVIEHLNNPIITLNEFKRILTPKGKLILTIDVRPKITGCIKEFLMHTAEKNSSFSNTHPEVHKKTIFSDKKRPKFFDAHKIKNYLSQDYTLLTEDFGGGAISNLVDAFLVWLNSLAPPKKASQLADHYSKLQTPLVKFYIKTTLPIIKLIAKMDHFKPDAFTILLVYEKKS